MFMRVKKEPEHKHGAKCKKICLITHAQLLAATTPCDKGAVKFSSILFM